MYSHMVANKIPALCKPPSTTCEVALKLWVVGFGVASAFVSKQATLIL
jgi:hypothetical protein